MKQIFSATYLFIIGGLLFILAACNKDKGNYTYSMPEEPIVTSLDSVYNVFVGDSLVIAPIVTLKSPANLLLTWKLGVPDPTMKDVLDTGARFNVIFGLGPQRYSGLLTIANLDNGMKYFHRFDVVGKTAFSVGTTVLSLENGLSQVSFIRPDGAVQARLYAAVNPSESLPGEPTQLLVTPQAYQPAIKSYWVFGKKGTNTGIQIDANTFRKIKTLGDNFFDEPDAAIVPSKMFVTPLGVISGVINGRLYDGTTNTWDQAPTYGMFGLGAVGEYDLSPEMVLNYTGTFGPGNYIGFDKNKKQFVRFNLYGGAVYFGPAYAVTPGTAFNPLQLDMDLQHLQQINGGLCYAFCRAGDNALYELKFDANFNGPFEFNPIQKRLFSKPELILSTTKWAATPNEIIYFSSGDKIYRYNPTNLDFKILNANFGGKTISMIKIVENGNTLLAGTEGSLFYLDISTGKNGEITKTINGIPGSPVDAGIRAF